MLNPKFGLKRFNYLFILTAIFILSFGSLDLKAQSLNGFDISNAIIDKNKILQGGPPKDGIPAINNPKFIKIKDVDYLNDEDIIIGVIRKNSIKAYPTRILIWHEIVNDTIDGDNIVVTYCPLCGTAMVFDRDIAGEVRTFGVSGLLYESDVLMYDKQSESLWSQLGMQAISGSLVKNELKWLKSEFMTWKAWKEKYPNSHILSTDTGFYRDYNTNAYASYFGSTRTMFPVSKNRVELAQKSWVIGVVINGVAKAYNLEKLKDKSSLEDSIDGVKIKVNYDKDKKHHRITDSKDKALPSVLVYWFAWQAFYPKTLLW